MTAQKRVLVTGGAGYIGSHMVLTLLENNYIPIVVDNLSKGIKSRIPKDVPFYHFDLCDQLELSALFKKEKIDSVMHFAASTSVPESIQNPFLYYHNNFYSTLILLRAMQENNINRIIFSSTAAIYGKIENDLVDENAPKNPQSSYGQSKLMCEQLLKDFDIAHGIKSVSLRYFNAAGADPLLRTGFCKDNADHLLPIVLRAILNKQPLKIFGNDYDTPDGTCVRDFVHVMDLCRAHLLAMNYLEEKNVSAVFNVGNGCGYSVRQVVESAQAVSKRPVQCEMGGRREGDLASVVADASLIRRVLGWRAVFDDIDTIIKHSWEWVQAGLAH